jgi:hypothetical protein
MSNNKIGKSTENGKYIKHMLLPFHPFELYIHHYLLQSSSREPLKVACGKNKSKKDNWRKVCPISGLKWSAKKVTALKLVIARDQSNWHTEKVPICPIWQIA